MLRPHRILAMICLLCWLSQPAASFRPLAGDAKGKIPPGRPLAPEAVPFQPPAGKPAAPKPTKAASGSGMPALDAARHGNERSVMVASGGTADISVTPATLNFTALAPPGNTRAPAPASAAKLDLAGAQTLADGRLLLWVAPRAGSPLPALRDAIQALGGQVLSLAPEGNLLAAIAGARAPELAALAGVRSVRACLARDQAAAPAAGGTPGLGDRPPTAEEQRELEKVVAPVARVAPNALAAARAGLEGQAALATAVDNSLSACFPPIRSQGAQGSCTCWAACYYYSTFTQAQDENLTASDGNNDNICSPAFMYPLVNGGSDQGAVTEAVVARLGEVGCGTWALQPYSPGDWLTWPGEAAWVDGLKRRTGQTHVISGESEDGVAAIKQLLANGQIAVTRTDVYSNWYPTLLDNQGRGVQNGVLFSHKDESYAGSHALTIVGYDDNRAYSDGSTTRHGAFLLANSWGPNWGTYNSAGSGSRGYLWVGYDYFKDPNACFGIAFYNDDRVRYRPRLYAAGGLNHAQRGRVTFSGGIGPVSSPAWTSYFAVNQDGGNRQALASGKRLVVDLSDGIPSIAGFQHVALFARMSVASGASSSGTLAGAEFYHDFDGDGAFQSVTAGGLPVTVAPGQGGSAAVNFAVTDGNTQVFTIANPGSAPLSITSLASGGAPWLSWSPNPAAGAPLTIQPGGSQLIMVKADPVLAGAGSHADQIKIASNVPGKSPYPGAVYVNLAVAGPRIEVAPDTLDFGPVAVGAAADLVLTVRNTGGGTLAGSASADAPFSITAGGAYSLAAGQSQPVTVRFSPVAEQACRGTVAFTGGGVTSRTVSGRGMARVRLSLGAGCGAPGTTFTLPVSLRNSVPARGVQFDLDDIPDLLEMTACGVTTRSAPCTVSLTDHGSYASVLLASPDGEPIPAGQGPVCLLSGRVKSGAVPGTSASLELGNIGVAGQNGIPLPVLGEPGVFSIGRKGDLDGDGDIDLSDILREMGLALGRPPQPNPYEQWAGDVAAAPDGGGGANLFDVLRLIDLFLGRAGNGAAADVEPILRQALSDGLTTGADSALSSVSLAVGRGSGQPGGSGRTVAIALANSVPVRGIQLELADLPDVLDVTGCAVTGRAPGFLASVEDHGAYATLLLVSLTGGVIEPGSGAVLEVVCRVHAEASTQTESLLQPRQIMIAGQDGQPLAVNSRNGRFVVDDANPLDFWAISAAPPLARLGTAVAVTFASSKALLSSPTLTVNGHAATIGSHDGLAYGFTYRVRDDDPDGWAAIIVSGRDRAGNPGATSSTTALRVDKTPPSGRVVINRGAAFTSSTSVALSLAAEDGAGSGVARVCLRDADTTWSAWMDFADTLPWSFAAGDGLKEIFARVMDRAGNTSSGTLADAIALDTRAPESWVTQPGGTTTTQLLTLRWTAGDGGAGGSGLRHVRVYWARDGGAWSLLGTYPPESLSAPFDAAGHGGLGTYRFYSAATDQAGNEEAAPALPDATVTVDQPAAALAGDAVVARQAGAARLSVTLSQAAATTVTVGYGSTSTGGTAQPGVDYDGKAGTLAFSPGVTSRTLSLAIRNNPAITPASPRVFFVNLTSAVNAGLGARTRARVTIVDRPVITYLLGLMTDATGLDLNGDGYVNIADELYRLQRAASAGGGNGIPKKY